MNVCKEVRIEEFYIKDVLALCSHIHLSTLFIKHYIYVYNVAFVCHISFKLNI